LFSFT